MAHQRPPKGVSRPCTRALQHDATDPQCCKGQCRTIPLQGRHLGVPTCPKHVSIHWILYFMAWRQQVVMGDSHYPEDQMEGSNQMSLGSPEG